MELELIPLATNYIKPKSNIFKRNNLDMILNLTKIKKKLKKHNKTINHSKLKNKLLFKKNNKLLLEKAIHKSIYRH